jgi:2Fe-2S ferredoxin
MSKISFIKDFPSVEVPVGANLMQALMDAGRAVASSCGGEGVCGKCWIKIIDGEKNLSLETDDEKFLKATNNLGSNYRISCQAKVLGDIKVDAPYW